MPRERKRGLLAILALAITLSVFAAETADKYEQLWRQKAVADYLLEGQIVRFGQTTYFETRVKGNQVASYSEDGQAAAAGEAITVERLFALINRRLAPHEYVEVRRYDREYGLPQWIGQGRTDVTDTGGFTEVTRFVAYPDTAPRPVLTYQEKFDVEDFDGTRLLLREQNSREGGRLLVQSLTDRKLVPVVSGLVAGGRARLAWPNVVWSNLTTAKYFLTARNLESGEVKILTREEREECYRFSAGGRWVAWENCFGRDKTLNLLDLETGQSSMVAGLSDAWLGDALVGQGQVFWIDEGELQAFRPGQGTHKIAAGNFRPDQLVGVDGEHLYWWGHREGRGRAAKRNVLVCSTLATGRNQEVLAGRDFSAFVALGSGFMVWMDRREDRNELCGLSLDGGTERQISRGFGERSVRRVAGTKVLWDDLRYGIRVLHCYDWRSDRDEVLWTGEDREHSDRRPVSKVLKTLAPLQLR